MAIHRQPTATLIIRRGPGAGQQFAITGSAVTVGRHGSCDIQVNELEVSRQHARFTWSGTDYVIEDLGSANGTFVNGERISGPQALKDGDLLRLGRQVELAFHVAVPVPSDEMPTMAGVAAPPSGEPAEPDPAKRRNVILVAAFLGLCFILTAIGGLAYFFWPQKKPTPIIVATLTPTPSPQVPTPTAIPTARATVPPSTPETVSAPGQPPPSGTILWPIDATMKAHLRQVMQGGQAKGKRINVFAKIGDSITESMAFLNNYCCGWYDLGPHTELEEVIQYFAAAHVDELEAQVNPYHTSFDRMSLAAESGAHAAYMLEGGADSSLMREINAIQPGLAIIMFGTNEALAGEDVATYTANLKQMVTILKEEGIIPILSTIPDLVPPAEGGERIPALNQAIKEVALEEQVPLMDYWQALQPLPNKGLDADGIHPNVFMEGDEYRSGYLTPEGLQYGFNVRNELALEMLAKVKAIVIDDGPPDPGGLAGAVPPTEPPVVSPAAPPATEMPPEAGAVRSFPDADDGIHVFNDQLAGGSMTEEQFRFAATHYVGCQKMTRADTRHLRQHNPGFIVLHYRLGLGLGYQEPDPACQPNGNWLHIIEGDEWVQEWPGDEVVEEGWFFPWAGQPRVYNCDWGWYVIELNAPAWRSRWSDGVMAQMAANEADGLFADSFSVPNYLGADHYSPPLPQVDAAFEEAWARRIEDFIVYLQGRFGEYYLIPNVGQWVTARNPTDYSGVDGVMIEGFSEWEPRSPFDLTDWQLQMNRILDLTRQDKVIIAQSYLWDPGDVETRLFYLGNYLLVKGRHSYLNIEYSMEPEYFPEYDIELGPPLDELPAEIDGYLNAAWDVYSRRYANGLVLVNPDLNTRSIDLEDTYYLAQPSGGGLVPASGDISAWSVEYRPVNRIELASNQAAILLSATPSAHRPPATGIPPTLTATPTSDISVDTGTSAQLIQPTDLVYLSAFRLPDGPEGIGWEYSGAAMTYYPHGDPNGPDDGFPGSIFGTGHDWNQYVSEISIPVPIISPDKNVDELNTATTLQDFHNIQGNLFGEFEIPRVGLEYLPAQGGQTTDKLYFCWAQHMGEGETNPSHGWCELDLSSPQTAGAWRIGDYWNYVTTDYIFAIPPAWADANTPGMYLVTGRFRDGGQGTQGPSLLAYGPWNEGNPPAPGSTLPAVPLLFYGNIYTPDSPAMNDYHHSDEWAGGAWLTTGDKSAVIFVGTKGTGDCWYGCSDGTVWPDEPPYPPECPERGWWSTGFVGQIIFYDPADLAAVARGEMEPYEPQPYATLNIDEYLYHIESSQQKHHVGAASFDRERGLLYVFEPLADGDKSLIHVWRVEG